MVEFKRLKNDLCIMRLYGVLEIFLRRIFQYFRIHHGVIHVRKKTFYYLFDFIAALKQVGVDFDSTPFDKPLLEELNAARNCIVHSGGFVDTNTAQKLSRLGAIANARIELPDTYFAEACRLV